MDDVHGRLAQAGFHTAARELRDFPGKDWREAWHTYTASHGDMMLLNGIKVKVPWKLQKRDEQGRVV